MDPVGGGGRGWGQTKSGRGTSHKQGSLRVRRSVKANPNGLRRPQRERPTGSWGGSAVGHLIGKVELRDTVSSSGHLHGHSASHLLPAGPSDAHKTEGIRQAGGWRAAQMLPPSDLADPLDGPAPPRALEGTPCGTPASLGIGEVTFLVRSFRYTLQQGGAHLSDVTGGYKEALES